ncbi:MAG: TIR domain-containing protein, partial [bacterium]|nr:TIR domain-containing protein [bacterium]
AEQLRDWIVEEFGEKEVFLDLDPRQGLAPGERWKDALKKAAHRCQVVLALISQDWLRSRYCQAELATATLLGKRVISIILDSTLIEELPADLTDTQFVRLDDSHWKSRLREGLRRARLDPAAFAVDESRPPYPGLRALEEEDAAIFFGRDAELVRADSELRLIRERGVQRILLIVGASGSGKSSFLRAGLWRRLERDDTSYFILPVVRPDGAVLTGRDGLDGALERALTDPRVKGRLEDALPSTRGDIADALFQDPDSLTCFASALAEAARIPAPGGGLGARPAVVLCIDQGEELLAVASGGHGESAILAGLLGRATGEGSDLLVLLTVRSDSLPRFEQSPHFSPLFDERLQTLSLPRLSPGNFSQIIEGPASLMRDKPLRIDPALTQKLLEDTESQPDALPLLAFTLQRLYERYGSDGDLRLDEYERFGGLLGALEAAERELRSEAREKGLAATDHEFEDQLRRVFIPHLVAVNEDAEVVRRVAELDDLPPDVRPLVEILVDRHHLLRTDMRGEEKVVEVAHEALLREWRLVDGFVQDVRVDLGRLRELTRAADSWASRGHQREYLDHKGERLLAAEKLLVDERLRSLIDEHPSAAEYIRACRRRDEDEAAEKRANRERERRDGQKILQRTRLGLAAAIGGVVVAAVLTVFATDRAREAREQTAAALEQRARAETAAFDARIQSLRAQSEQYFARANLNAIQAVKTRTLPRRPDTDAYVERLIAAMDEFREKAESALERAHELVSLPESQRSLELLAVAETTPRADSLFELEMVKAKFGTALLIRFGASEEQRTILYGGGPPGVFKRTLRPLLANKAQAGGLARPKLDLVIAPQQDFEYLDGIDDLFKLLDEDASQGSPLSIDVGGLWHNHFAKMLHDRAEMEATPHEPFRDR